MDLSSRVPPPVLRALKGTLNCEFATVSGAGVPIDTPMIYFPTDDLATLRVATGLAYPAKAERARRNPQVGLLLEGGAKTPVVAICGRAAVRDSDIQANTDLYLAETAFMRAGLEPWPNARHAVWYWARMIVEIAPARILWWDTPAAMDFPPQIWEAPEGTVFPQSDEPAPGKVSPPAKWPQPTWRELAEKPVAAGLPAHLTLCDADGYPIPIRVRSLAQTASGFELDVPTGIPWPDKGKATLTFFGRETFVGFARRDGARVVLEVERALPINPFMGDPDEVWRPGPEVREAMMGRLTQELERRGQSIPDIPEDEPFPSSECGEIRMKRLSAPMRAPGVD